MSRNASRHVTPLVAGSTLLASIACGGAPPAKDPSAELRRMTLTSPAFGQGGRIPVDHTCDGDDVRPELVMSSPPEGTKSLVIVVDDPDAPSGLFTHMVAFDLAPDLFRLPAGKALEGGGESARFATNDFGSARYGGPCPPRGEVHRYRFRVLALDRMLDLPEGVPHDRVEAAMAGHVLGGGGLVGIFGH